MGVLTYIDTSMLVKRYVPESGSEELEQRLAVERPQIIVSDLLNVELTSSLRRMERKNLIDRSFMDEALQHFTNDIAQGRIQIVPLTNACLLRAAKLMRDLKSPLATLDAIHLATALIHGAAHFFTTDVQLSRAAKESGLTVWPEFSV